MKVALDLEDVLVETIELFMEELDRFVDEKHPDKDIKLRRPDNPDWAFLDLTQNIAELQGWEEEYKHKFFNGDSDGWEGFLPMTGRIWKEEPERYAATTSDISDIVKDIREIVDQKGGKLDLVTARLNGGEGVKKRLEQMNVLQYIDSIVLERDKDKLDYDVYIDDYPYLHTELNGAVQVMLTRPWNRDENLENPHIRIKSVGEAPEVIRDLG